MNEETRNLTFEEATLVAEAIKNGKYYSSEGYQSMFEELYFENGKFIRKVYSLNDYDYGACPFGTELSFEELVQLLQQTRYHYYYQYFDKKQ